jgi:glutamate transport system permease protein
MDTLIENFDQIRDGFYTTIWLLIFAGIFSTILGTILASFRVSPVGSLRAIGTSYVNTFRNTPLVLILALAIAVIPTLGFNNLGFSIGIRDFSTFFVVATLGLSAYTAAFVCEAVRSGVNSVAPGQAEAARSVGMSFLQSLRLVVLPQAFRAVIPPLNNVFIALTKNTSIAVAFSVAEATSILRRLQNQDASATFPLLLTTAAGYLVITLALSFAFSRLERRVAVTR